MPFKEHRIAPLFNGAAESVIIFLHGLGDNGAGGLLDIGRIWQRALPHTEFLCPDAPFEFDLAPSDFGGRQWFSLKEFTKKAIDDGVLAAAPLLDSYIDDVLASRKLPSKRLALVGFSQGTMMALYVALRRAEPVAAVLGYSGRLVHGDLMSHELKSSPPVLLVHGTADAVVPFCSMNEAARDLKAVNVPVQTLSCPHMGHSIDEAGIEAGLAFLQQSL